MRAALVEHFLALHGRAPEFVARAPGRIEVIGNHTDYNGGTVLGAAIDRGVWVALARRGDGRRRLASAQRGAVVEVGAGPPERQAGEAAWANYPLGVLAAFPASGLRVPAGFDYLAMADLPPGAGLSSSAALELASALVFAAAAGERPERAVLVEAARRAENEFVGVPCGILDQAVSGFGRKDHLVFIDCRGPRIETVPLPVEAHFWIFNPPTRHALVDGLYAARHRDCLAAARALGVAQLADATPAWFAARAGGLDDVEARRARHVIEEIARVDAAMAALRAGDLAALGRALTASHRSSQRWFENSTAELDFLVDRLAATPHVHGARLTGGGFGGAVLALTDGSFGARDAEGVAAAYAGRFGPRPEVLHARTGAGAELFLP
jgi:galactokinase